MTVSELVMELLTYPLDMRVLMDDNDGWYCEVETLVGPVMKDGEPDWEESEFSLPTLVLGEPFDSRSL
jgi:hypothetical protein